MSENEEPDRLPELAMPNEAVRRDIELGRQFFRDNETVIRQVQQAQPVIQAHAALWREIEPIVEAAQQFVRDAQRARASRGPALPFAQRVALAVDAGLRELLPARMDADVRPVTLEASVAFPAVMVASGGLVLSPMSIAGQGTVEKRRTGLAALSDGQILALVLVAIVTSGLLAVPARDQATVGYDLAVIGIALTVALAIWNKGK